MRINRLVRGAFRYLFDPNYRFLFMASKGKYREMPDQEFLSAMYKAIFGQTINWETPTGFNEKLQWLKLYNRRPEYTMMVDKYLVRDYIAQVLGEEFLIPLLGVWDSPEDIDFDRLPNQIVLKCNHNSGLGMCICRDKSKLDIKRTVKGLKAGLAEDYYLRYREWLYKDVPRKIIAEQFMGADLMDYKIHCFSGEPRFVLVCSDRFSADGLKEDFYDTEWNLMDLHRPKHPNSKNGVERPRQLEQMLEYSKKLAKDIPFVRVDFYIVDSYIYFGEMTFFPASGLETFTPAEWDATLGRWISLPEKSGCNLQ